MFVLNLAPFPPQVQINSLSSFPKVPFQMVFSQTQEAWQAYIQTCVSLLEKSGTAF